MTSLQAESLALDAAIAALRRCESPEAIDAANALESIAREKRDADANRVAVQRVAPERFNQFVSMSDEELRDARTQLRTAMRAVWDATSMRGERFILQERYDRVQSEIERRKVRR